MNEEASTAAAGPSAPNPCTYDDLFPSLPASAPGSTSAKVGSGGGPGGDWNKKPMLSSQTVTQVRSIEYLNFKFTVGI